MLAVMNAKNKTQRKAAYVDLLKITGKVLDYARTAVKTIKKNSIDPMSFPLFADIEYYAGLTEQVVSQTQRRMLRGESVAAQEKVVVSNHRVEKVRSGSRRGQAEFR